MTTVSSRGVSGRPRAARDIAAGPRLNDVRVVILTTFDLGDYVYGALRAGATGFLVKDTEPEELVHGVRVAARGDALISPSVTRRLIAEFAGRVRAPEPGPLLNALTDREHEVMSLVAAGLTNDEIAARLVLSPATKTRVGRIMTKHGLRDRLRTLQGLEVFLVSRIHEEWERVRDAALAVREGLAATGRVITAAAAVMVVVFAAFVLSPSRMLQQFGLGPATAILLDAVVIRCLVVPAVMHLLGRHAWRLPAPAARRLPRVTLEPAGPAD